ncbi:MAG: TPM domain-containing protein [Chitinophagaceae bacterium]|jgi:uncharacterized membrane protein|nr:TPM domain-containing protein [Chitinophagaceae bacterium]HRN48800.1 TPM domain-containing protein [Niabella sp.]
MSLSFFRKKPLDIFSKEEKEKIVQTIRNAECSTSGEIRVYIEGKCKYIDPVERATEIFYNLQMQHTQDRNGVLLYVALRDRQIAIFGDEGIYKKTGKEYWEKLISDILSHFDRENFAIGISECVRQIGEGLTHHFPYQTDDHNELPDEIVFGK